MKKLFLPYELAAIAKEKGFKEPCMAYTYTGDTALNKDIFVLPSNKIEDHNVDSLSVSHPLYAQIIDWFREEHKIHIEVNYMDDVLLYNFKLTLLDINEEREGINWKLSYYDALEAAIEEKGP